MSYLISIVIPIYEEEKQIYDNIYMIHNVLNNYSIKHEFILVDDGSKDDTWIMLKKLTDEILHVQALRLSRNFGKEAAISAGLNIVRGDACVVMDADLQHPPEIIPEMIKLWHNQGYNIVEGVKTSRGREKVINKICAYIFYKVLHRLTGYDLNNATDFKLIDFKVLTAWRSMNESNIFFRGMSAWLGFRKIRIPFAADDRLNGESKWSIIRLYKLAITAITSFSSMPLQIVTFLGILLLILDIPIAVNALLSKFKGQTVDGITTIIFLLLIIGSIIMISLGIIGTYIAKIFDEVKHRPIYLLSEKIESPSDLDIKNDMNLACSYGNVYHNC